MANRRAARGRRGTGAGGVYRVRSLGQVRALANPLRMRILEALAASPKTTKQVSELLGESATKLYHHVAALEKAGLVRLRKTRPLRGTVEKYYQSVATHFEVPDNVFSGAGRPALSSAVTAILDQAREGLLRATAKPGSGSAFEPLGTNARGRVTAEQYAELRRRLLDVIRYWEAAEDADADGVAASLTVVLFAEPPEND